MKVTAEMLKGMDIFSPLKVDELKDIAELCQIEEYEQGRVIFKEGDHAEKIYMVLEGRVSIEIEIGPGKTSSVYVLTKGEFYGYPSLISAKTFTTSARCLDKVIVVTLKADDLVNKIFKNDCRRGYLIMHKVADLIAQKLHETRMQILSLMHG